jgi:hypothetical protein
MRPSPGSRPSTHARAAPGVRSVSWSLLALLLCSVAPRRASAFGDEDKLSFAQLVLGATPHPRPTAQRRLAWEIEKRTSINTVAEPVSVSLSDESALRQHPLLLLSGEGPFPTPSANELERLRRHLTAGGLLVLDDASGRIDAPAGQPSFDASARTLVERLFPRLPFERIPSDHVLFKTFYLVRSPVGRTAASPSLEGVIHEGRLVVVYSRNDLGGAWAKDSFGRWEHEVVPGGELQREQAIRLGINLAMYALCLDYKSDQVHVPFILRRRQWQSR